MLPDRSKRYASTEGEIPRLDLTTYWQLALLALLMLSLLYLIFPQKALVEQLYEQETMDELTLSYIKNLYRADTRNADAAILLAKFGLRDRDLKSLEELLLPFRDSGDLRQRTQARITLVQAYTQALDARPSRAQERHIRDEIDSLMQKVLDEDLPITLARQLASMAFRLGLTKMGDLFMQRFDHDAAGKSLEQNGIEALARGQYALAARYFLLARARADNRDEARRLFQLGINALMSGRLYALAMSEAQLHLGDLENDLPTLRYMVRTALAAAEPVLAARYVRRLVFRLPSEFRSQP
jgi:hypothetical protein